MKIESLREWEELRDAVAEKRENAKRVLDQIYAEEMAPVFKALADFQSRCKHPRLIIRKFRRGGEHQQCPDCDYSCGWGASYPTSVDKKKDAEVKEALVTVLKRKNLL